MSAANTDEFLDEIATQIRAVDVPGYPAEAVSAALADKFKPEKSPRGWQGVLHRRPVQFLGAAALLLIVAGFVWIGSPFGSSNGFAFAEVQQAIGEVNSVSCRILTFNNSPRILARHNLKAGEPTVVHVKCTGDEVTRKTRTESFGVISITSRPDRKRIIIVHSDRTAVIEKVYPMASQIDPNEQFLTMLRNVPEHATKRIGERRVSGRDVVDFMVTLLDELYTVTVDAKTKLPTRMEKVVGDQRSKDQGIQIVYTDFLFDAVLEESQFKIEVPTGYALQNHLPPDSRSLSPASDLLVVSPDEGIGPVKFGDNVAQIIRLLGQPDWQEERDQPSIQGNSNPSTKTVRTVLAYHSRGFRLDVDHDNGLQSIYCLNQLGAGDAVLDFRGNTKEGLTIRASRDDVLKVYGEPDKESPQGLFYYVRGYQFHFYRGKLGGIFITLPEPASLKQTNERPN
jgi:hypothetical protein